MSRKYFYSILVLFSISLLSCSSSEYLKFNTNNEYIVNFYLSNQNRFCTKPVHFIVTLTYLSSETESKIDVFDEEMDFGTGLLAGHNTKGNKLILKEGSYHLSASTNSNDYKLDIEFEIVSNQWIYIGYNVDNQFNLIFSSTPFIFC